jgi:sec-independent protein translocase protein TatA
VFGLQPVHLVFILIIALLIFGPQRLPELTRGLGQSIREFKRVTKEVADPIKEVSGDLTGRPTKNE